MNRRRACALPVVVAAALVLAWTSGARASLRNPDTDWMSGHYGIGFHYIQNWMGATKDGGPVEWNAAVDSFDVNRFASDAASTGARWVLFTSGQNSGYYVAPCAYMNSFSGYRPGERCSNRDLLQDMGNALAARGLRLVIYLPANAPKSDARIANGFGLTTKDSNGNWHVNDAFTQKWSGVVREWSLRYGDHVGAWWFDGFYGGNGFVSSMGHWYSEAARAGNAHEIIALNGGASSFDRRSEAQDYIAGESGSLSKNCTSRWLQDVQCHTFITLGSWGGADPIKYNDDQIVSHTNSNLTVGAAMTWNIGVSSNGIIKSTHLAIFQRIRSRLVGSEPPGPTPTPGPTATPTPTRTPTPTPMPDGDFVEITPAASAVSASTNDGNLPGNTVDNSLATRWSANGDGQWIQYDLGTTRTVSRVKVAVYNGNSRRNHFELQLSACCGTWATVFSGESSGTTTAEAAYDFAAQDARYVRYLGHGNSVNAFNSVTEVSLFAPAGPPTPVSTPTPTPPPTSTPTPGPTPTPTPDTPVDITPGAAGVTASTNDGNVPANTVDKSLSTRWSGSGDGAWIQYDLGTTRTVTSVRVAWYAGNTRRSTFDVLVAASPTGPWAALLAGRVTSGTTLALEEYDVADTAARYMRLVGHGNDLNTWNSVTEVEVWGR